MDGNFPVEHRHHGFAKSLSVANWLFAYCGWKGKGDYPCLSWVIEVIEWPEGDVYFPCNQAELWVLGGCLHMN